MTSIKNIGKGHQRTVIEKIPQRYSKDLSLVIRKMLIKNPN